MYGIKCLCFICLIFPPWSTVSVSQVNFISEGHMVWGGLVIGLTSLPMAVQLANEAVAKLKWYTFSWWQWLLLSPLLLALYLLAVAVGTP